MSVEEAQRLADEVKGQKAEVPVSNDGVTDSRGL